MLWDYFSVSLQWTVHVFFVVFHLYAFEMKRFLLVCPKKQQRLDAFEGCDSKYHNPIDLPGNIAT